MKLKDKDEIDLKFNEGELTKDIEIKSIEDISTDELWDEIGFHKPLGGWWYNLVFMLINLFTGTFLTTFMISYFYPYPEISGYLNTVNGMFALLFFTFDIGTASIMQRFVPEARINNLERMIQYIRYFIWYQMITGLVQLTGIAVYCFYFSKNSKILYLTWVMLIISTKQYPGMLGVFYGSLRSMQHFDKAAIVAFTQGEIIQRLTELLFVYLGKLYGQSHPGVGILLGITLGAAIGRYVDDFLGMALSAHYFTKVMKIEEISVLDCFIPDVPWDLIKEVFIFGLKTSIPGFISGVVNLYILILYLDYVPQYITFAALNGIANGIVSDLYTARLDVTSLYAESYMNGKKKLSQTILMKTWRFFTQMIGFYYTIFISVYYILPDAFSFFHIENYLPALPFIIPALIGLTIELFINQSRSILIGVNKPMVNTIFSLIEQLFQVLMHTIFIIYLSLGNSFSGIIFLFVFGRRISYFFIQIFVWFYIHKKIFKVKIAWFQTIVSPILASISSQVIVIIVKRYIYDVIYAKYNFLIALLVFMIILIIVAFPVYFPLYGFMGGHDVNSLSEFKKAVKMSGPSKWIVSSLYNLTEKLCSISPLFNKFALNETEAIKEALELYKQKLLIREEFIHQKV